MSEWLAIALGGSLGAVIRVAFADWEIGKFPAGIFAVNIAGCLLIGIVTGLINTHGWPPPIWRSFLIAGLLGALTTFSTFGLQSVDLAQKREWMTMLAYVAGSVCVGIMAVWIGLQIGSIGAVEKGNTI
jgi:CrcB protein